MTDVNTAPCSYQAAHKRLTRTRGRAKTLPCVDCGQPADSWSYNGDSALEQTGTTASNSHGKVIMAHVTWSPDPADYSPRCSADHIAHDWTAERREKLSIRNTLSPNITANITIGKVTMMSMMGMTPRQIADALGCHVSRVHKVIQQAKRQHSPSTDR